MSIFIDFDGTITPVDTHGFLDAPEAETVRIINELYDSGFHEIVIYSCRGNIEICDPSDVEKMERYLKLHGVKYHRVQEGKPLYDYIIDDRAFNPSATPWEEIRDTILMSNTVEPEEDSNGEVAEGE